MSEFIFEALPPLKMANISGSTGITGIIERLCSALGESSLTAAAVRKGQNINYCVYSGEGEPKYLLRVITRKGYPNTADLREAYDLAKGTGLKVPELVFEEGPNESAPYGLFVQTWLPGSDALDRAGITKEEWLQNPEQGGWLERCVPILRKIHSIRLPHFGGLTSEPVYTTLRDYYNKMLAGISYSFGDVLSKRYSIRRLDELGVTTPGFLDRLEDSIALLSSDIPCEIEPTLVHGDMFPWNIVWNDDDETVLIDWDEARSGWVIYEIARTLFYAKGERLLSRFFELYGDIGLTSAAVESGIKLEHIRQFLRIMVMTCFNTRADDITKARVRKLEEAITARIHDENILH